MAFKEFFCGLDGFVLDGSWALGDPNCEVIKLLRIDPNPFSIPIEEYEQCGHRDALVAILKRMVLN